VTLTPGIHDAIPSEHYHNGGTTTPSLSASIANLLITKSAAHARANHPTLNPNHKRKESDRFDIGTAAHALLLQGDNIIAIWDGDDWRKKDAQAFRDAARSQGRIPLLADQADDVRAIVSAARQQVSYHTAQPALFTDGKPEQTLVWEDDHGVLCRARLDWLRDDYQAIDDYKTTSASADPDRWTRTMYGIGADVQVAFYERGVERLTGIRPVFRYAVQETYPPYALSVVDLAPSALELARDKVSMAIVRWARCLEEDAWPAYDQRVASIEAPTWEEMRWLERQEVAA